MQPYNLNIFDFDGTLVEVNSFKEISKNLAFTLCQKLRIAALFELVIWYFSRKLNIISHLSFKQRVVDIFEKSLAEEEKKHICQTVFDNNVNKAVLEQMLKSDNCVICTASPFAFISRISFNKNITMIGSLDPQRNLCDPSNFGTGKIENLKAYFTDKNIQVASFYTDSNSDDQALIDFSVNAFVVEGGRIKKIK